MQNFLEKNQHFYWNEKIQEAFDSVMQALAEATALAAPTMEDAFFGYGCQCSSHSQNLIPRTRTQRKYHLATHRLWQQVPDSNATILRYSKTGNVHSVLLH